MKSLYHEIYYSYTPDADVFSREIEAAIKPILKHYFNMGYSPRELGSIINDTVGVHIAEMVMVHACKESKKRLTKLRDERNPGKILPWEEEK